MNSTDRNFHPTFDYSELATKIQPIIDNNSEPILNKSILASLGYTFEYDKFKRCEHARLPYMSLWWDDKENSFYALIFKRRVNLKYLYEFQQLFCVFFCHKFKPGYDLNYLDSIISLDRKSFMKPHESVK